MAWVGLALLFAVGAGVLLTGLPAFFVLLGAAALGGLVAFAAGDGLLLTALPSRLVSLMEGDLLQALPLFVLMGALLNRLPLAEQLFTSGASLMGRRKGAPLAAALGLGALLAPMNGSVGASVAVLTRAIRPRLAARGVAGPDSIAAVIVAATLGVVIPPSLVLILLGDAMMAANTIASNAARRYDRIVNTQDIFQGAFAPALLFLALCLVIVMVRKRGRVIAIEREPRPERGVRLMAVATLAFVVTLLGGVAFGFFYAVEAAAFGAVALLAGGLLTGHIDRKTLSATLADAMAVTGALFALLAGATTFTLVIRTLGTDRLLAELIASIPGSDLTVTLVVLGVIALCALILDAFEIIFVVVPIVMPALLTRVSDAVWVSVLTLLALQMSFLMPPLGYAVMMARSAAGDRTPTRALIGALAPFVAAQLAVLALTAAWPPFAHLAARRNAQISTPVLSDREVEEGFRRLAPSLELPPPPGGAAR